jgi:hypothetical protein
MSESPMRKTLRTKERPEFQNKRSTTVWCVIWYQRNYSWSLWE